MLQKHEQDEDEDGSTIKFQTMYGRTKLSVSFAPLAYVNHMQMDKLGNSLQDTSKNLNMNCTPTPILLIDDVLHNKCLLITLVYWIKEEIA